VQTSSFQGPFYEFHPINEERRDINAQIMTPPVVGGMSDHSSKNFVPFEAGLPDQPKPHLVHNQKNKAQPFTPAYENLSTLAVSPKINHW
jgi:hypothetical protein